MKILGLGYPRNPQTLTPPPKNDEFTVYTVLETLVVCYW